MTSQHTLCLGFIIYFPEITLLNRIELALSKGIYCYIYDNTPEEDRIRNRFQNYDNICYLTSGKNSGLGIALSTINAMAYYKGYNFLLFFDQDTGFTSSTLDYIINFCMSNENIHQYTSITFSGDNKETTKDTYYNTQEVQLVISSGSVFVLENAKKVGFHNIDFFVDCVDYEFCLNSSNKGYKMLMCFNTPDFDHVTEQADKPYSFLGKTLMLRVYPMKRVTGTILAYLKLIITTIKTFNFKYFYLLSRSATIYIMFQILARILTIFKK